MNVKRCIYCNKEYPRTTEYFYKQVRNKDGLFNNCKKCHRTGSEKKAKILREKKLEIKKLLEPIDCELMYRLGEYFTIEELATKYNLDCDVVLEAMLIGSGENRPIFYKRYLMNKSYKLEMIERKYKNGKN